ncbi:hypothetical protein, partial [Neisseria gonorrhoeae]|uniref:hypothetical protein n=1 Tax=Neisseria gonorrhoeae TaxID=485 RepID=UPI00201E5F7A
IQKIFECRVQSIAVYCVSCHAVSLWLSVSDVIGLPRLYQVAREMPKCSHGLSRLIEFSAR